MGKTDIPSPASSHKVSLRELAFRGLVGGTLILLLLSLTPWFGGTGGKRDAADRLIEALHVGGFRVDVGGLVLSTVFLFLALFLFVPNARESRSARTDAVLCLVEVVVFCVVVCHALISGTLYFG